MCVGMENARYPMRGLVNWPSLKSGSAGPFQALLDITTESIYESHNKTLKTIAIHVDV